MHRLIAYFRDYRQRKHVRPWALCAPIVILLICLPLLRPLRHPDPRRISDDELARLATIEAIVEHDTLAIDQTSFAHTADKIRVGQHLYSNQPPVMAALLSSGYQVMYNFGLRLGNSPVLVPYLLTLLGVTIPVAAAAGILYRMSRIFELPRYWRASIALCAVLATGLVSYGVVLNSHAPAAALILASAACLIHVAVSTRPALTGGWIAVAGFCAALAAVIDLPAVAFVIPFGCVILAMRWRLSLKAAGLLMYVIGLTPPIVMHAVLTVPVTGDLLPGSLHPELAADAEWIDGATATGDTADTALPIVELLASDELEIEEATSSSRPPSWIAGTINSMGRVLATMIGPHGVFSHFPVLLVGIGGIAAVMHRHWPFPTKALATVSIAGAIVVMLVYALSRPLWNEAMFATRWFVVFLPLVLFWAGAWVRRNHHPVVWTSAAVLLVFSISVSLIGATDPFPRDGFDRYTAVEAAEQLLDPKTPDTYAPILAGG